MIKCRKKYEKYTSGYFYLPKDDINLNFTISQKYKKHKMHKKLFKYL